MYETDDDDSDTAVTWDLLGSGWCDGGSKAEHMVVIVQNLRWFDLMVGFMGCWDRVKLVTSGWQNVRGVRLLGLDNTLRLRTFLVVDPLHLGLLTEIAREESK